MVEPLATLLLNLHVDQNFIEGLPGGVDFLDLKEVVNFGTFKKRLVNMLLT